MAGSPAAPKTIVPPDCAWAPPDESLLLESRLLLAQALRLTAVSAAAVAARAREVRRCIAENLPSSGPAPGGAPEIGAVNAGSLRTRTSTDVSATLGPGVPHGGEPSAHRHH